MQQTVQFSKEKVLVTHVAVKARQKRIHALSKGHTVVVAVAVVRLTAVVGSQLAHTKELT
jgi:hypothetical protein